MRPTAHRRYLLRLQHRDQAGIARVALQAAVPVLQSLAAIPLSAWSDGADVGNLIRTRLAGFAPVLGDAALLAWLKGRQRAFAEAAAQAGQPLDYTAYLRWPRLELPAGRSGTWRVDAQGMLTPAVLTTK